MIGTINRIWAWLLFTSGFLKIKLEYEGELDRGKQYVLCPNHFSYLDIPAVALGKINAVFVGKSEMEKIPLFGWMYSKLHITVNRDSLKSRYQTILRSLSAVDEGKSLVIFPEGGISTKNPPNMTRFKEGPFRVAIEKKIEVVPVTIYNNWRILPDILMERRLPIHVKFHKPISTEKLTLEDMGMLKEKVFNVIDKSLKDKFDGNR